jgi:ATP-dependent exoDNAse (exonuclease V) beta subunit
MNLIYVALTRARKQLYVLHDESEGSGLRNKHVCSIVSLIPRDRYNVVGDIETHLENINRKLEQRKRLIDEDTPF